MTDMDQMPFPEQPGEEVYPDRPRLVWDGGRALLFFVFAALSSILLGVALLEPIGFYASVVVAEIIGFAVAPWVLSRVFDLGWTEWLAPPRVSGAFWGWALL
ncbi:MAG TPA: hypothetical protein VM118_00070, partial [Acidobacteriota bacterium]|nr:hypothetical protein [Acidobacteriota bacterium]